MKLGSLKDDLIAWAFNHLDIVFSILRWIRPNIVFDGKAFVTRFDDVNEVLARDTVFQVPYTEKIKKITNGVYFTSEIDYSSYTRDSSDMRLIVREEDLNLVIRPFVTVNCQQIMTASAGKMDVVREMTAVVPARLIGRYLGISGWDETEFTDALTSMFQYLLHPDEAGIEQKVLQAAEHTRAHVDQAIAERKANRIRCDDDVLGRCLKLQSIGVQGMSDEGIRNMMLGLMISAIPTTSKHAALTLNYLFDHPELLVTAQQAARTDQDELLIKYMLESMRFASDIPGVERVCTEDYVVAKGTLRSKKIPKGTKVLVATQSAMMDWFKIDQPAAFRLDRPAYQYLHFSYGLQSDFGQYINTALIPVMIKAVLKQKALRRTTEMKFAGSFPASMNIEFDTE